MTESGGGDEFGAVSIETEASNAGESHSCSFPPRRHPYSRASTPPARSFFRLPYGVVVVVVQLETHHRTPDRRRASQCEPHYCARGREVAEKKQTTTAACF